MRAASDDDLAPLAPVNAAIRPPEPLPLFRPAPDGEPFPIEALGPALGRAARAIMARVQCPDALAGNAVLAAAALAAQAHADVVVPATGHPRPLSLFIVSVAGSGERKSAADSEALRPIREREAELRADHARLALAHENAMAAWETARAAAKKAGAGDPDATRAALDALGSPPVAPYAPMLTAGEPTGEGLCKLFAHSWPGLGLFSAEGGAFIGGHALAPESRLRTFAALSELWDGSPIRRVRAGDGATILPGRRLSLHLMVQPDAAAGLLADPIARDQGLLSRVLVAAPPALSGTRFLQGEVDPDHDKALRFYTARILDLLHRPLRLGASADKRELDPRHLTLDPDGVRLWTSYYNHAEADLRDGRALATVRGFGAKLAEHVLRIAGVLALVDDPDAVMIPIEALERAIRIADFYASEAVRLFGSPALSPEVVRAEALREWLLTGWHKHVIGLRHIVRLGPNAIREARSARAALVVLEAHGWVTPIPSGAIIEGERAREAWHIWRPSP